MLLFTLAQTNHVAIVAYDAEKGVSFNCKILALIQGSYFRSAFGYAGPIRKKR
jgi:hypothetical protein